VGPAFARSADFAIDKPAGRPCPALTDGHRCGIHAQLRERGFAGCTAYDCFGAGQQVVQVTFGGRAAWTPEVFRVFDVMRQLHELLWYAADALDRPAAAPVHADLRAARDRIEALTAADPGTLAEVDPATHRATVAPLLRRASRLTRAADPADQDQPAHGPAGLHQAPPDRARAGRDRPSHSQGARTRARAGRAGLDLAGQDLSGRDLRRAALRGADLSLASLLGADLRDADLRTADLLGADLRGADLSGADLTGALYLTAMQVAGARGTAATRLPTALPRPGSWPAGISAAT
jgi:hypothetical protein